MLDPKSLLPEIQKLMPSVPAQEIMQGIQQFAQAHPDANNAQALQALMAYLQAQKQAPAPAAPAGPPFQNLINQLPSGVK